MGRAELEWISKHGREVEKHSGKWIALKAKLGIVASDKSLDKVVQEWRKRFPDETPFVFLVPRKDEEAFIL